jgi:hypothetical protein
MITLQPPYPAHGTEQAPDVFAEAQTLCVYVLCEFRDCAVGYAKNPAAEGELSGVTHVTVLYRRRTQPPTRKDTDGYPSTSAQDRLSCCGSEMGSREMRLVRS